MSKWIAEKEKSGGRPVSKKSGISKGRLLENGHQHTSNQLAFAWHNRIVNQGLDLLDL